MSQRKKSQPKNADHEKSRWTMKTAVKSSADCQAWNLAHCRQLCPTEEGDGSDEKGSPQSCDAFSSLENWSHHLSVCPSVRLSVCLSACRGTLCPIAYLT